jgi:signal peptidase I
MIQQPQTLNRDDDSSSAVLIPRRRAWVAALLGLFFGPLAFIYCGRFRRGAGWYVAGLLIGAIGCCLMVYFANGPISLLGCLLLVVIPQLFMWIDAIRLARGSVESPRRPYQRWWIYSGVAVAFWFAAPRLANFLKHFWAEAFFMPTQSMNDTLLAGDRFLVDRLIRRQREPHHGEVVAFHDTGPQSQLYVKRVIGLPGDVIDIRNERVYRNGEQLDEPYVKLDGPLPPMDSLNNFGPHTVATDKVFLLGDARRRSKDSRFDGDYPLADVIGVARVVFWSGEYQMADPMLQQPEKWGNIRWNRIGLRLD